MSALSVAAMTTLLAVGTSLLLSGAPWFRRARLVDRVGPYTRGGARMRSGRGVAFHQLVVPGLERWGTRISTALGVRHDLSSRLERAGLTTDPAAFRVRQATLGMVAALAAAATVVVVRPPLALAAISVVAVPVLVVLIEEHRVTLAADRRRDRVRSELPVVAEQLGLLLSAGYSLPGAVARLADRSDGAIAVDLRQVARRVRQGLSATEALDEWAVRAGEDAIDRLVAVLRLHDDAGDLGGLIAEEARSIRAAAHRDLLEVIERRAQLVWVPVTVATLVPGLIFLAVPFMSAMAQVTGT